MAASTMEALERRDARIRSAQRMGATVTYHSKGRISVLMVTPQGCGLTIYQGADCTPTVQVVGVNEATALAALHHHLAPSPRPAAAAVAACSAHHDGISLTDANCAQAQADSPKQPTNRAAAPARKNTHTSAAACETPLKAACRQVIVMPPDPPSAVSGAAAAHVPGTRKSKGVRIHYDLEHSRTCVIFDGAPSKRAVQLCQGAGFWWSPSKGAWVRRLTLKARRAAEALLVQLSA
jgi:hypothetical protein